MNWGSELLGPLGCVLVAAAGAVLVGRARWRPAVRDAAWGGLGLLGFVGAGSWWWAGGAGPHAVAAAAFAAAAVWAAAKTHREGRRRAAVLTGLAAAGFLLLALDPRPPWGRRWVAWLVEVAVVPLLLAAALVDREPGDRGEPG